MPIITYSPANLETLQRMLAENGRYIVEVHNRRIVKCEKAASILPPPEDGKKPATPKQPK